MTWEAILSNTSIDYIPRRKLSESFDLNTNMNIAIILAIGY